MSFGVIGFESDGLLEGVDRTFHRVSVAPVQKESSLQKCRVGAWIDLGADWLFRRPIAEETSRQFLRDRAADFIDRKSTRLNSSHQIISYAVFCLKKKK